jgi:preprotein translocase subunit SecG
MSTIETVLLSLLVIDALALTGLVLMQQGKGADVGAAFGSGSSSTMFGSAGSTSFLTRATAWLAIGFFVIAFSLAYIAKERAANAGSLGIPVVPTQSDGDQLTGAEESVDSQTNQGDVPALDGLELDQDLDGGQQDSAEALDDIPEL